MNAINHTTPYTNKAGTRSKSALWVLYPLALAAIVGTFYLLTLRTGIGGETDSAKWQFVGKVLGVPHNTGYPLYILLNRIFSCLPFGTLAWRINFMSAFFAVCAVVTLQRILRGLLKSEILALGGALLFAVSPMFWTFATEAGVYSLNAFFVCLVIYFLFKWSDARRTNTGTIMRGSLPPSLKTGKERWYFYAACLVYALSFGNHVTMITLLPAFVFFALKTDWRAVLSVKTALLVLLFIVITASLYSLPFISTDMPSPYLEHRVQSPDGLRRLITAEGFRKHMFAVGIEEFYKRQLPTYLISIAYQYTIISVLVISAGLFLLATEHRLKLLFLLIYLLVSLFTVLSYDVAQWPYQLIPSYIILAIIMGFSAGLFRIVTPYLRSGTITVLSALCMVVLLGMAGFTVLTKIPEVVVRKNKEASLNNLLVNDAVDALPDNGVILANGYKDSMLFFYKMLGEKRGREKDWRVMHDTTWRKMKPDTGAFNPENPASRYDMTVIEKLLKGEAVNWTPLALEDKNAGKHEIYFWAPDKVLMDMAGCLSERVDLPGEAGEKNIYGGETKLLYRITGRVNRTPGEIVKTFNKGLDLKNGGKYIRALRAFASLVSENRDFAEVHFQRGLCFRGVGRFEKAREEWKKVLNLIPNYKPAEIELKKLPQPPGQTTADLGGRSEG